MTNTEFILEEQIKDIIQNDNKCQVRFLYNRVTKESYTVDVITINPINGESFLMKSEYSPTSDFTTALENIKEYVMNSKNNYNSYTVLWKKVGESHSNVSYFYGRDMFEILNKFYTGKENIKNNYSIYDIKLNPIS